MGFASKKEALSKGPVVRALDEMSAGPDARVRLTALRDALKEALVYVRDDKRQPDFPTLADVIRDYLFTFWSKMRTNGQPDPDKLNTMTTYLKDFWFGPQPHEYATFPTRGIYGMGLLKAIDSSLRGSPDPLPMDAYWFIHADRVEVITLESARQVTVLISTPPPVSDIYTTDRRAACEAWVTTATADAVHTEVSPPDLDPSQPITPVDPRSGDRICTYKIEGGP
jgi:hypothetical protein